MIQPRTLSQMIERSGLETTKAAIVAELKRLLLGVNVIGHPGKLDINDVVARAVVPAPGVAVGWTRIRADRQIAGSFNAPVEWAAYIVVEDTADRVSKRAVSREQLGHAIGQTILEILDDPDVATWGVPGLGNPSPEPAPALVPMFTMKSYEAGGAIYAVTWTQVAWDAGTSYFEGETPRISMVGGEIEAELPDGALPPHILALLRDADANDAGGEP